MELNLLNFIFINFTVVIFIFGNLINLFESYLPIFITQTFRYGKHCYKGDKKNFLATLTEIPKSWFKHFYIFALIWSWLGFILIFNTVILSKNVPEFILKFFDFITGTNRREILIDSTSALIASALITLQCTRRFYETNFLQIFSSNSKMNLSHYLVGYFHYFGTVLAVLVNTEGFIREPSSSSSIKILKFNFETVSFFQFLCISLFLYSWLHQYRSNLTLVNLRKDSNGKILTEKHLLPIGGYFECISSPHMLFEVLMYIAILGIIPSSITWRYITIWVITNQTENAWLTHKWYKENFKNYPKRYAIFPFIL